MSLEEGESDADRKLSLLFMCVCKQMCLFHYAFVISLQFLSFIFSKSRLLIFFLQVRPPKMAAQCSSVFEIMALNDTDAQVKYIPRKVNKLNANTSAMLVGCYLM